MSGTVNSTMDIKSFDIILGVWGTGLMCMLGIIGNITSLVVLAHEHSKLYGLLLLKALSVCDAFLLASALLQQVLPMACTYLVPTGAGVCQSIDYIRIYSWPIVTTSHMCAIWLTILISAERCSIVYSWRLSYVSVKVAIGVVVAMSIIFNIPKFFEYVPTAHNSTDGFFKIVVRDSDMRHNIVYRYLYNSTLYCLLMFVVPLVSLVYFNTKTVYHILREKHTRREFSQIQRKQLKREYKAMYIPLCIVILFFISESQVLIIYILDAVYVDKLPSWLIMYTGVSNFLVVFNSAVNFLIFYLFGARFRKLLRRCCCGKNYRRKRNTLASPLFQRRFNKEKSVTSTHTLAGSLTKKYAVATV